MKIKETRYISAEDLRALCIKHDWFTRGNNKEYEGLFNMLHGKGWTHKNMTPAALLKMAQYIQRYSDPSTYEILGLEGMIFCLCEISMSCFSIEE